MLRRRQETSVAPISKEDTVGNTADMVARVANYAMIIVLLLVLLTITSVGIWTQLIHIENTMNPKVNITVDDAVNDMISDSVKSHIAAGVAAAVIDSAFTKAMPEFENDDSSEKISIVEVE